MQEGKWNFIAALKCKVSKCLWITAVEYPSLGFKRWFDEGISLQIKMLEELVNSRIFKKFFFKGLFLKVYSYSIWRLPATY